jgi:hypothetical protein
MEGALSAPASTLDPHELFRHAHVRFDRHFHKNKYLAHSVEPNRWRVTFPPADETMACVVSKADGGHLSYVVLRPSGEKLLFTIKFKRGSFAMSHDHTVEVRFRLLDLLIHAVFLLGIHVALLSSPVAL